MNFIRKPFRYSFFNAVLWIIVANVFFYFLTLVFPRLDFYFALNPVNFFRYKMFWQPVTYMFVHAGFRHLFFNMLGLLFFGIQTERAIGSKEFLLMYFLCGILSGIFSLAIFWLQGMFGVLLMGASGAIYSILLAYSVIFPRSVIFIWGIIPVPAPILVLIYAGVEFFAQFGGGNIAHWTHLAGFIFAFLYFLVRMNVNPIDRWRKG